MNRGVISIERSIDVQEPGLPECAEVAVANHGSTANERSKARGPDRPAKYRVLLEGPPEIESKHGSMDPTEVVVKQIAPFIGE